MVRLANNKVEIIPEIDITKDDDSRILGKITFDNQKFFIHNEVKENLQINNDNLTDLQEKIWYVVQSSNNNNNQINNYLSNFKYVIKKNDIIKLGRVKFLVKHMNISCGEYDTTKLVFKPYFETQ